MPSFDIGQFQAKMNSVVRDYLYQISSSRCRRHNYFSKVQTPNDKSSFYRSHGFQVLYKSLDNKYVVEEEMLLEGHTRTFLINPIIEILLNSRKIRHEWCMDTTFSNPEISNRDFELGAYIEFIFEFQGKNIGCRYTPASYSSDVAVTWERDAKYLYNNVPIPGFDKLEKINELWVIDWSGISAEALAHTNAKISGLINRCKKITSEDFFDTLFGKNIYPAFRDTTSNAIKEATNIIALKAIPQLLPNNMLRFKDLVSAEFSKKQTDQFSYIFHRSGTLPSSNKLSTTDLSTINFWFHTKGFGTAVVGDSDFSKSFVTSEYLFQTLNEGLAIDYTAVVVGYLKSVEQLLYLYYISAFAGEDRLDYWDKCKDCKAFDLSDPTHFRFAPYNKKGWKQQYYSHYKRTGKSAPEFGELCRFLRDNAFLWNVTESSKEFICSCLDDFRTSCRNNHFHKDNISCFEYDKVKEIRNNAKVCIFYLLGGFKLLDLSQSPEKQLGIVNDSFDRFYNTICQERRRLLWVEYADGYEGLIYYLNQGSPVSYHESGRIENAELRFIKLPHMERSQAFCDNIQELCNSESYVRSNLLIISRGTMPKLFETEIIRKKPRDHNGKTISSNAYIS